MSRRNIWDDLPKCGVKDGRMGVEELGGVARRCWPECRGLAPVVGKGRVGSDIRRYRVPWEEENRDTGIIPEH